MSRILRMAGRADHLPLVSAGPTSNVPGERTPMKLSERLMNLKAKSQSRPGATTKDSQLPRGKRRIAVSEFEITRFLSEIDCQDNESTRRAAASFLGVEPEMRGEILISLKHISQDPVVIAAHLGCRTEFVVEFLNAAVTCEMLVRHNDGSHALPSSAEACIQEMGALLREIASAS